jgi:hypothetical protein
MHPSDIPENTFVAIMSSQLDYGFCYGHVKHYNSRSGAYSHSAIKVSPTCSFKFPASSRIEPQEPNEMEIEYFIYLD